MANVSYIEPPLPVGATDETDASLLPPLEGDNALPDETAHTYESTPPVEVRRPTKIYWGSENEPDFVSEIADNQKKKEESDLATYTDAAAKTNDFLSGISLTGQLTPSFGTSLDSANDINLAEPESPQDSLIPYQESRSQIMDKYANLIQFDADYNTSWKPFPTLKDHLTEKGVDPIKDPKKTLPELIKYTNDLLEYESVTKDLTPEQYASLKEEAV